MLARKRISKIISVANNRIHKAKQSMLERIIYLLPLILLSFCGIQAQDFVTESFKDTRVINSHSVETLPARKLDIRIGHRFGDMAGDRGGWQNFYGLESAADVLIGADYGITDRLTVGLNRTKGVGVMSRLINTSLKYRLTRQTKELNPFSITLVGEMSTSTLPRSTDPNSILFFESFSHRLIYSGQILFATVIGEKFTVQLSPGYIHRNIVGALDVNGFVCLGVQSKYQVNKAFALIFDTTMLFTDTRRSENGFYLPLGFGFEFDTGGHVFQINLTNATGLATADYIPNTTTNWADGEFRLGFTISRLFNL